MCVLIRNLPLHQITSPGNYVCAVSSECEGGGGWHQTLQSRPITGLIGATDGISHSASPEMLLRERGGERERVRQHNLPFHHFLCSILISCVCTGWEKSNSDNKYLVEFGEFWAHEWFRSLWPKDVAFVCLAIGMLSNNWLAQEHKSDRNSSYLYFWETPSSVSI